jgi:propanediol utilization protein
MPAIVETASVLYPAAESGELQSTRDVPLVQTTKQTVLLPGEIVSTQHISRKTRTIETVTVSDLNSYSPYV